MANRVLLRGGHLLTMDRGFDGHHVDVVDLAFPPARYPTPASRDTVTLPGSGGPHGRTGTLDAA